ncbi:MAG: ATP-grasp domain-containing protein [Planctomycetales bacterium]|nr:ATP-grasp domain-containing protein [Planctomycetales bacterium]
MRIFVSEYVTTCDWPKLAIQSFQNVESLDALKAYQAEMSLANEGLAMLSAVVADLAQIPDMEVHVTRDAHAAESLCNIALRFARARKRGGVDMETLSEGDRSPFDNQIVWHEVTGANSERQLFERLASECDATLIIAPEFRGILAERCRWVEQSGASLLGPSSTAVELCTDKLALSQHLQVAAVPTIDTYEFDVRSPAADLPFPVVIKPRDGAGSQATYQVQNHLELVWLLPSLRNESLLENAIWQPFIRGQALSVGVLIPSATGKPVEALPVCVQVLSQDGRFHYQGGRVPARCERSTEVQRVATAACESVSGLRGYVGVDLVLPDDPASPPVVVEINPRLTTSYLGYQTLCKDNLAERILFPDREAAPLRFREAQVGFAAFGFAASDGG